MPSNRVREFYSVESYALIGMSRTRKNFAWTIYDYLRNLGRRVYPVRPDGGDWQGVTFFESLESLPEKPDAVIIGARPPVTKEVLDSLRNWKPKFLWMQQGSYNRDILAQAKLLGLDPIKGCVFMYMPGASSFHGIHRFFNDLLGKGYK